MGQTQLGCGMSCLKYLLFVVNFIVWVCGIVVFGVGIYSRVKAGDWKDLVKDVDVVDAANLLIASGAIVMVIGFVGCCGAVKQLRPLLVVYIVLLVLIFILEIAGGIYAAVKKDDVIASLKKNFGDIVDTSYGGTSEADKGLTKSVDWFQENVKCCGSEGPKSWSNSTWVTTNKRDAKARNESSYELFPKTCCKSGDCNVGSSEADYNNLSNVYEKGCVDESEEFLNSHIKELVGVGVGIAFVQIVGVACAILLCRSIGHDIVA